MSMGDEELVTAAEGRRPRMALLPVVASIFCCFAVQVHGQPHNDQLQQELQLWTRAYSSAMQHVRAVSWKVDWQSMGFVNGPVVQARASPAVAAREQGHNLYINCIDAKYKDQTAADRMSWEAAMADDVTKGVIKIAGSWWSNHMIPSTLATVVTSSSMNRLNQLYAQCKSFNGPVSAVLWLALYPLNEQDTDSGQLSPDNQALLRAAVLQVAQFMADMQATPLACRPDITLVWEMYKDEAAARLLYPMNIPRNLARLQARTPLIAEIDIDLVVSRSLKNRLVDRTRATELISQANDKTVFIIPAFDVVRKVVDRASWADALASGDKEMMVYAFRRKFVHQFDVQGFAQGHNMSNYPFWVTAQEDYDVTWSHLAEPWFVGARTLLPWHDARYRGYGKDKVQYVEDVGSRGYKFRVLHNTYAIHRAHKKSEVSLLFLKDLRKNNTSGENFYTHFNKLFANQCFMHDQGIPFYAPIHAATKQCMGSLPWWRGAASTDHYLAGASLPPLPGLQPGVMETWGMQPQQNTSSSSDAGLGATPP